MDSNQRDLSRQADHLGVNKLGKNIRKSPLHQPNFPNANRQQPQPQVYNINKNDFRNIVQQLTGSPLRDPPPPRPPQNHPKPPNNRLQRVRPPPLASTGRPQAPSHPLLPIPQPQPSAQIPYPNNLGRPPHPSQYDHQQHSPNMYLPPTPADVYSNTTESPISAYMRYLQNSIMESGQVPGQNMPHQPHVNPHQVMQPPLSSPRLNGPRTNLPSPRMHGPPQPLLASPRVNGGPSMQGLPLPRANGPPPLLPSPTSQYLLPSPTNGFWNMLSPRSPYPLLSPGGYQNLPPLSPNFSFSSMGQSGILGPGPHPPPSPGYGFPLSPSGFFSLPSPGWRGQ